MQILNTYHELKNKYKYKKIQSLMLKGMSDIYIMEISNITKKDKIRFSF